MRQTLETCCKKWLRDLRDMEPCENLDYPEFQLTKFERNLLKDLKRLFPEEPPDTQE